ncbi:cytochrome c [Roseibium hamelinense]|uniref:Cytochrome c n=1 Tax=Roseibium hamelinense TaxID=150831 RepID=A0A562T3H4_9HYPH|nr:cytochrome c family protein [Roseibium hamelinense]MTI43347.1 cytochrome c family protein [Roseibium hamelinense]TWI87546.1 cytochrome c [Roseibium hamelinense]
MKRILTIAGAAFLALSAQASAEGDAAAGESVFRKCQACHAVGEGARNKVGPQLNGVVGREAASVEGYRYSKAAMEKAPETGAWTTEGLMVYLEDPSAYLGGRSKMAFKLRDEQERADVIAYLATFNADGTTN